MRALCLIATLVYCSMANAAQSPPNILLIVADDLGYADLGVHGSEIRTPNIDALAQEGVLFTQFHTAPYCAPTRAMLLSGNNNHVAGVGQQKGRIDARPIARTPGYEGHLSNRIAPLPRLLKQAGYHTYTAGKWHLGSATEHSPLAVGFERSFNLVDGAGNHFNAVGFFDGGSIYRENGKEVSWPQGAYSTELYTDKLIEFIDADLADDKPFFAFAAYTSPHWPLQVPDEQLDRYAGHYEQGYDKLREENFEALLRAGIIPSGSQLPPRNDAITLWEHLSSSEKKREARKMQLYAAMVENLDDHVGRLIKHLERRGIRDNTLIVFISDNGAAAGDFYNGTLPKYYDYVRASYDNKRIEEFGRAGTWVSYGAQWAEAGSAPFSYHKSYASEGGIVAPMFVSGPGITNTGSKSNAYLTAMDLAPTFLELAGAKYPSDLSVKPMLGESMTALLAGKSDRVHDDDYVTTLFHRGHALIRQGRWKLTALERSFHEDNFALYDVISDPGEVEDLSEEAPKQREHMLQLWRQQRVKLGITLPQDL
jgi:arylsulfatase A-like enzyme